MNNSERTVRIGTSGWSYDHWAGVLYRPGLPVAKRLARYVEVFDTVELNASFYRWPRDATFDGWRTRLPQDFTMSVKAHRGLSHFRRLATPEPWAERLERCQRALGERREAVLVQLHPDLQRDDARLDHFLQVVPDWIASLWRCAIRPGTIRTSTSYSSATARPTSSPAGPAWPATSVRQPISCISGCAAGHLRGLRGFMNRR